MNGPKLKAAESTNPDALHTNYPNANAVPGSGGGMIAGRKNGGTEMYGATIGTLALALSYPAGRPVVDKTGLTGRYDMEIPRVQSLVDATPVDGVPTIPDVLKTMGLKLETQKVPVEMLAIDHVERPTEN